MDDKTAIERAFADARPIGNSLQQYVDADSVAFEVRGPEDLDLASDAINTIKKIGQELDSAKKSAVGPIQEGISKIKSWFAPYERQIDAATDLWKGKITRYIALEEAKQRQTQTIVKEAIAAGDKVAAREALAVFQPPPQAVGLEFRNLYDFEVVDITKVPVRFLTVLSPEVRVEAKAQVKAGGEPEIPGLRFFLRKSVRAVG